MSPQAELRSVETSGRGALWAVVRPGSAGPALRRVEAPLDLRGPFTDPAGRYPTRRPSFLLRNATAGVFAGDVYDVRLRTAPGATATVGSPSATQVYASVGPAASTRLRLEAEPGSSLYFVPKPTILHAAAKLDQSIELICHPGAALFFTEILVLGRLAMGERLAFERFQSQLQLRRPNGTVLFEERYTLEPQVDSHALEVAINGAGAITPIVLTGVRDLSATRERIAARLDALPDCSAGADELPDGAGLIVRGLAADARAAVGLIRASGPQLSGTKTSSALKPPIRRGNADPRGVPDYAGIAVDGKEPPSVVAAIVGLDIGLPDRGGRGGHCADGPLPPGD